MGKALTLRLKQTRLAGKSIWVRCDVVLLACSKRPAKDTPDLGLQARFFGLKRVGRRPSFECLQSLKPMLFKGMQVERAP